MATLESLEQERACLDDGLEAGGDQGWATEDCHSQTLGSEIPPP